MTERLEKAQKYEKRKQ